MKCLEFIFIKIALKIYVASEAPSRLITFLYTIALLICKHKSLSRKSLQKLIRAYSRASLSPFSQ